MTLLLGMSRVVCCVRGDPFESEELMSETVNSRTATKWLGAPQKQSIKGAWCMVHVD